MIGLSAVPTKQQWESILSGAIQLKVIEGSTVNAGKYRAFSEKAVGSGYTPRQALESMKDLAGNPLLWDGD